MNTIIENCSHSVVDGFIGAHFSVCLFCMLLWSRFKCVFFRYVLSNRSYQVSVQVIILKVRPILKRVRLKYTLKDSIQISFENPAIGYLQKEFRQKHSARGILVKITSHPITDDEKFTRDGFHSFRDKNARESAVKKTIAYRGNRCQWDTCLYVHILDRVLRVCVLRIRNKPNVQPIVKMHHKNTRNVENVPLRL